MYSPLDQFDVVYFSGIYFYLFNLLFSNIFVYMFIYLIVLFCFFFMLKNLYIIPSNIQLVFEFLYKFIIEMLVQQAGKESVVYFPLFYSIFFFILFFNLIGMLPFGFTVTSHLMVAFFFALSFNLGFLFLGLVKNGFYFFKLFVPKGAPFILLPLIVVIEIISYLIRTFSLSIRLFANMLAGHCLLYVVSSFIMGLVVDNGLFIYFIVVFVYLGLFILEFAIAFLQAYVFVILLCIYLKDSLHPSH